jgi:N-dimethylarginine dimethylaminohydrolase
MDTTDIDTAADVIVIKRAELEALLETKVRAAIEEARIIETIQDELKPVVARMDEKNKQHGDDMMLRAEAVAVALQEGSESRFAEPINAKFEELDTKLKRLSDERYAEIRARSALVRENADLRQEIQDLRNLTALRAAICPARRG